MALFAIGDLHLCLGAPKPMDVFGGAWVGYMEKLQEGLSVIGPEDTTVLLGDLSWALDLEQAKADFSWMNQHIPGRKIILKGNHDYWWSTAAKFQKFCQENGFSQMHLLNNNCYEYENWAICGTRAGFLRKTGAASTTRKFSSGSFCGWRQVCKGQGSGRNWCFSTIRPAIGAIPARRYWSFSGATACDAVFTVISTAGVISLP